MDELDMPFTRIIEIYRERFTATKHHAHSRREFMESIGKGTRGVYLFRKKDSDRPIYIGSSGKIGRQMSASGSTIRSRLFYANTPYYFSPDDDKLHYGPTTPGVPPEGYSHSLNLDELEIEILQMDADKAPSVLEHLFIQGYLNEFNDLPEINQKV